MTSSDGSAGRSSEKRQRFEAARRAHYNMRAALRIGRQLASASEDDRPSGSDEDEDEDETNGGSGSRGGKERDEDEQMQDCGSSRCARRPCVAALPAAAKLMPSFRPC
jgi:hypothetical protein